MWKKIELLLGKVWLFIKPTVLMLMSNVGKLAQASATAAVIAAAADYKAGKSGDEVKAHAIAILTEDLKSKGIQIGVDVGLSFINTVIEMALQKAKDDGTVAA